MNSNIRAPLKNPLHRSSRREEAQIVKCSAVDQSLVTSAAAIALAAGLLLASTGTALAALRYVDVNSAGNTPPYTSWATAATNIQDAVDAAEAGDEIVVTNGIYATGGRAVDGFTTNRVAVDKPLNLRSINGPQFTTIDGGQSNRCAYLTNGASLSGFTLTNGRAHHGGGLWCESTNAVVSNCAVSGNSSFAQIQGECCVKERAFAGGVYGGTLSNCTLSNNRAETFSYNLRCSYCFFIHDDASFYREFLGSGGGVVNATLNNCTLTGNSAGDGGGAYACILNNCTVTGNSGGGASKCTLNNCTLTGNSAYYGGGANGCILNNCTLTGNSASYGGGAYDSTLNNCIVYFNTAPQGANYWYGTLNYSCTTPQPNSGVGNISLDPQLARASRLSAGSPCRGAGNAAYASGTDIDGEAWASPPSIGCDEYHADALTGPLSVAIAASFTTVRMGFTVQLTALIEGRAAASSWDFADGIAAPNQPYTSHAWTAVGDYAVVLRAYNESQPGGISATVIVHVVTGVHYVAADSTNSVAPYASWATAATNLQDAINVAIEPGPLVLVTNGTYAPIAAFKFLTLLSVNGPLFTVIDGGRSNQCMSLDGATVSGFTLTNGTSSYGGGASGGTLSNCTLTGNSAAFGGGAHSSTLNNCMLTGNSATESGGGAYYSTLDNCTITGNSATVSGGGASGGTLSNCTLTGNSASSGGGAVYPSTLNNCTITGNSAANYGGGAASCILNNCTLTGNSASSGGGASYSTLNNCIVYFNTARQGASYWYGTLNYSCTTPQPTNGVGNITSAPLFVDQASGNLRLQSNSPCINAGRNAFAPAGPDLDGNARIASGTVDIGAYEFQSPTSLISYAWLQQYALPTDGSTDTADPDGDRLNNWQEWRCGTDPTNSLSALRLLAPVTRSANVAVTWQSVTGVNYFLERGPSPSAFTLVATNFLGQPDTTTYSDTNAIGTDPWFYRVGVSSQ